MTDSARRVQLQVRRIESPQAAELFITALPVSATSGRCAGRSEEPPDISDQAREVFTAIAALLREQRASLWMERVFAPAEHVDALRSIRAAAYGDLADPVEPCWLAPPGPGLGGVQVHALQSSARPDTLTVDAKPVGRRLILGERRWITGVGLGNGSTGDGKTQAQAAFRQARSLLAGGDADFHAVARTWFFLDDILGWYDTFNQVRNAFFREQGLIGDAQRGEYLPASTGIGVSPARGKVALDLLAVAGPDCRITCYQAAGRQRSAFEYGSAFSRASRMPSPGGETLFVSGTAAIDAAGRSCHPGDARAQIRMTLENVRAVLAGADYAPRDVVQAIAYCATPEVAAEFQAAWAGEVGWPFVTVIGDICRRELLFEIEATAAKSGQR
ncbi:MAG TPA: Rid family hydrolase [Phycisphaerae bacterium]|jgi:enamine deaminase RidA (YjgF/YER057c/UK114 family)|nr:hypothetical protein [Phycisphaerae bacterium]HOB72893.1 Rid family hydrolase [Phycisphaerae bacterium]HOJ53058.1 Rid family hydrolase [Phycisphaerae bacterium]HOL24795.1 Rid family hydrolase [Phycisphaerae bacterium]HPP19331.1 Rid family hydrolase [Phycisphaerae bacterium]